MPALLVAVFAALRASTRSRLELEAEILAPPTIYGSEFRRAAQAMGIEDVLTAPRSPWQNPFVERVIGSLRRECLDHVIVWNERSLRRHLQQYLAYYHGWRTHLSLDKNAPVPRAAHPPTDGAVVQVPHLGGLHHHDERRAA